MGYSWWPLDLQTFLIINSDFAHRIPNFIRVPDFQKILLVILGSDVPFLLDYNDLFEELEFTMDKNDKFDF